MKMNKRKRERDRPKAAHDSPYDPNKRVQLSYSSGEEIKDGTEELPAGSVCSSLAETVPADYQIEEYPDEEEEAAEGAEEETVKGAEVEEQPDHENAVVSDKNDDTLWSRSSHRNHVTGQYPALGSLSYESEGGEAEEEYDSTEEDAVAYLRAVRWERQAMPEVFRAPNSYTDEEIYENGNGDTRGYLEDGAYVARASLGPTLPDDQRTTVDPQEAFVAALKKRFLKQRHQMHLRPSQTAFTSLDDNHPISFPGGDNNAYAEWHRLFRITVPLPAQVRSMQPNTVFRLIDMVHKHFLVREKKLTAKMSAWIWSLLARLDDVGTLTNRRVSAVREFAKKAILVQLSFRDPIAAQQLEHAAATEEDTNAATKQASFAVHPTNDSDEAMSESKALAPADDNESIPSEQAGTSTMQNTLATLDSIVVIVGEIFGQRDLLEFRQSWTTEVVNLEQDS